MKLYNYKFTLKSDVQKILNLKHAWEFIVDPDVPNELDVKERIDEIISSGLSDIDKAMELTLYCMKTQIFIDGNKRASIIFANHFMIGRGVDEIKAFLKEKCWRQF